MKTPNMKSVAALIFMPLLALAGGNSSGTRGGGEGVQIPEGLVLRDFVDSGVCNWVSGSDFMQGLSDLKPTLASLAAVDAVFADSIQKEGSNLSVCLTEGALTSAVTEDSDPITNDLDKGETKLTGIRWNNLIFISLPQFNQFDSKNQAYFFIHEVMHSFIDASLPQKSTKLRSIVASIRKNEVQRMSVDQFKLQKLMNSVVATSIQDFQGFVAKTLLDQDVEKAKKYFSQYRAQEWEKAGIFELRNVSSDALSLAVKTDNVELFDLILSSGISISNAKLDEVLSRSAQTGKEKILSRLTQNSLDSALKRRLFYYVTSSSEMSSEQQTKIALQLINDVDFSVNLSSKNNRTPLIDAIDSGNLDILAALLKDSEINLAQGESRKNEKSTWNISPLYYAIESGSVEAVRLILSTGKVDCKKKELVGDIEIRKNLFPTKAAEVLIEEPQTRLQMKQLLIEHGCS